MATTTKGFRLQIFEQGNDNTVSQTFYVGVSGQTSSIAKIPDVPSPEPDPYAGTMRSQNVRFDIASEAIIGDLGNASDRIDWTGRLARLSETTDDGSSYSTLWTGRVTTGPSEMQGPGKQSIVCQDENWLVRNQSLFTTSGGTTMLYPPGLVSDWADQKANPTPTWKVIDTDGTDRVLLLLNDGPPVVSFDHADYIKADVVDDIVASRSDGDGNFEHLRFRDTSGATDREVLSLSEKLSGFLPDLVKDLSTEHPMITATWLYWPSHGMVDEQRVSGYLYAPTAEPHPMNPRHIGGRTGQDLGEFLEDCFDGTYGDAVNIDTATTLATWNASTNPNGLKANPAMPTVLERITEPVDRYAYLRDKICAHLPLVLFTNADGEVAPRLWRIPQNVNPSSLTTFTSTNAEVRSYDPRGNEAITELRFKVRSIRRAATPGEETSADNIAVTVSEPDGLVQTSDNVSAVGRRSKTYDLTAFRPGRTVVVSLTYIRLAKDLARELFERVQDGPAWYTVETSESGVLPGDYAIIDSDTLKTPNPADNARTGDRIVQVATREIKDGGAYFLLTCQDTGPNAAILSAPTVSATATGKHTVDVTISGLSSGEGYRLFVDKNNDGTFEAAGTGSANETVTIYECPANTSVSAKAVRTKDKRIRSAFSSTASATTTAITAPTSVVATVTGTTIKLTFTAGDADYDLMPVIDGADALTEDLPAGSGIYVFADLAASTSYTVGVKHVDDFGGASSTTTTAQSTSTAATLPQVRGLTITQGRSADTDPLPAYRRWRMGMHPGIALKFTTANSHARHRVQVSTSSTFATVDRTVMLPAGEDAVRVRTPLTAGLQYARVRAERAGYTDGAWSSTVSAYPTFVLREAGPDNQPFGAASLDIEEDGTPKLYLSTQDPDTTAAYWDAHPTAFPTVTTADSTQALADFGTAIDVTTDADVAALKHGETVFVTVRFYNGSTGSLGSPVYAKATRSAGIRVPQAVVNATQSGSTLTCEFTVTDPDLRVTSLTFAKKTDAGNWGSFVSTWDSSTGTAGTDPVLVRTEAISMIGKHNVSIKMWVSYQDDSGTGRNIFVEQSGDSDLIAEITEISPSTDNAGQVYVGLTGDEDTANMYIRVTTDGTTPTDPTSASNDGSVAGRSGTATATGKTATAGDVVTVKAIGYDSAATPAAGPVQSLTWTVPAEPGAEANPGALKQVALSVVDDGTDTYTLNWSFTDVVDNTYDVDVEFYREGVFITSVTGTVATDGTVSTTATGDSAIDNHHARAFLKDSTGKHEDSVETFPQQSAVP